MSLSTGDKEGDKREVLHVGKSAVNTVYCNLICIEHKVTMYCS